MVVFFIKIGLRLNCHGYWDERLGIGGFSQFSLKNKTALYKCTAIRYIFSFTVYIEKENHSVVLTDDFSAEFKFLFLLSYLREQG